MGSSKEICPSGFLQLKYGNGCKNLCHRSQIINGFRVRFAFTRNKAAVFHSFAFLDQAGAVLLAGTGVPEREIDAGYDSFFLRKDTDSF